MWTSLEMCQPSPISPMIISHCACMFTSSSINSSSMSWRPRAWKRSKRYWRLVAGGGVSATLTFRANLKLNPHIVALTWKTIEAYFRTQTATCTKSLIFTWRVCINCRRTYCSLKTMRFVCTKCLESTLIFKRKWAHSSSSARSSSSHLLVTPRSATFRKTFSRGRASSQTWSITSTASITKCNSRSLLALILTNKG